MFFSNRNDQLIDYYLDDLILPYIPLELPFDGKQEEEQQQHHIQVKWSANSLVNDDHFSSIMHWMNEQCQLIDERDVDFEQKFVRRWK